MNQEQVGYSVAFLYMLLLIGIPLALIKPFRAFLVVVFFYSAADMTRLTFTRLPSLGPYFNGHDALLVIALIATVIQGISVRGRLPLFGVILWLIFVLFIGFVESNGEVDQYYLLRTFRASLTLPLLMLAASVHMDDRKKVRPLLLVLLAGAVVAALSHFLFVRDAILIGRMEPSRFRTNAFILSSPGPWLLIVSFIWLPPLNKTSRLALIFSGSVIAASIILSQTRSIWFAFTLTIPVAMLIFEPNPDFRIRKTIRGSTRIILAMAGILIVSSTIFRFDLSAILEQRIGVFEEDYADSSVNTRQYASSQEIDTWLQGDVLSVFTGVGMAFYADQYGQVLKDEQTGGTFLAAYGHLGHLTTLTQFGFLGLLVYSIYFPSTVLRASKPLAFHPDHDLKLLGILVGVIIIFYWIMFFMSGNFFSINNNTNAIVFGTGLRLAWELRKERDVQIAPMTKREGWSAPVHSYPSND